MLRAQSNTQTSGVTINTVDDINSAEQTPSLPVVRVTNSPEISPSQASNPICNDVAGLGDISLNYRDLIASLVQIMSGQKAIFHNEDIMDKALKHKPETMKQLCLGEVIFFALHMRAEILHLKTQIAKDIMLKVTLKATGDTRHPDVTGVKLVKNTIKRICISFFKFGLEYSKSLAKLEHANELDKPYNFSEKASYAPKKLMRALNVLQKQENEFDKRMQNWGTTEADIQRLNNALHCVICKPNMVLTIIPAFVDVREEEIFQIIEQEMSNIGEVRDEILQGHPSQLAEQEPSTSAASRRSYHSGVRSVSSHKPTIRTLSPSQILQENRPKVSAEFWDTFYASNKLSPDQVGDKFYEFLFTSWKNELRIDTELIAALDLAIKESDYRKEYAVTSKLIFHKNIRLSAIELVCHLLRIKSQIAILKNLKAARWSGEKNKQVYSYNKVQEIFSKEPMQHYNNFLGRRQICLDKPLPVLLPQLRALRKEKERVIKCINRAATYLASGIYGHINYLSQVFCLLNEKKSINFDTLLFFAENALDSKLPQSDLTEEAGAMLAIDNSNDKNPAAPLDDGATPLKRPRILFSQANSEQSNEEVASTLSNIFIKAQSVLESASISEEVAEEEVNLLNYLSTIPSVLPREEAYPDLLPEQLASTSKPEVQESEDVAMAILQDVDLELDTNLNLEPDFDILQYF